MQIETENAVSAAGDEVKKWIGKAAIGDVLVLPDIYEKYKHNSEMLYFLHKHLRHRFMNIDKTSLWTYVEDGKFMVRKVTVDEFNQLTQKHNLENELVDELLGFTKVFRLLKTLRKPIIGHNVLTDLAIMTNTFETQLPRSYSGFKKLLSDIFPVIFDTKTVSFELGRSLDESKRWKTNSLEVLYNFFKNGSGRHLALQSPYIKMEGQPTTSDKFHNAGWDSYCTGYIFIRMAHYYASRIHTNSKKIYMNSELLHAVSQFKNCLNVIRGSISYIVSFDNKDLQLLSELEQTDRVR